MTSQTATGRRLVGVEGEGSSRLTGLGEEAKRMTPWLANFDFASQRRSCVVGMVDAKTRREPSLIVVAVTNDRSRLIETNKQLPNRRTLSVI